MKKYLRNRIRNVTTDLISIFFSSLPLTRFSNAIDSLNSHS